MRIFVFLVFLSGMHALPVEAYVPVLITQESPNDITTIEDPMRARVLYGEMNGFPHTFEIRATEKFQLSTHILLPDIESSKNNVSGIIIKEPEGGGRVLEIARLEARSVEWISSYEPFGGNRYREGPLFEKELDAGTYRIEVHTPDNLEKYVLVIGQHEEISIGYFELIKRLSEVKVFFGKSRFRVIESPFVYVPLSIIGGVMYIVWYVRRRRNR